MTTQAIDRSIDVNCSQHHAFEKLSSIDALAHIRPQIAEVESVAPRGTNRAHIVEVVEGKREELDVELIPVPEERIDYHVRGSVRVDSSVTLRKLDEQHTKLEFHGEFDPQKVSDVYHMGPKDMDQRVQERLESIKSLVEGESR